jgi:hypothetical protein
VYMFFLHFFALVFLYKKRCEASNFVLRKSQKNVLKTMKKFLEKNERKAERTKKEQTEIELS